MDDSIIIPGAVSALLYHGMFSTNELLQLAGVIYLISTILQEVLGCLGKHQYQCTYEEIQSCTIV